MATEIEEGQFTGALSDWMLGKRARQAREQLVEKGATVSLARAQVLDILASGIFAGSDEKEAAYATAQSIDPANLALIIQMIETMAPLFMSGCA